MTPSPLRITAVIPTYNRKHFIAEAVQSVLAQTRPVDEIVVVDDGSSDGTADVLQSFGSRIRYVRQENQGPSAARNRGLREATGDFVALLDSDDLWVEDRIARQLELLARHPQLDFVFGDEALIWPGSDRIEAHVANAKLHAYLRATEGTLERIRECLIQVNVIPTSSVLLRRSCATRIGFFNERFRLCEDLEYWLRATAHCRFGYVNAVLVKRRRHGGNLVDDWASWNVRLVDVLATVPDLLPDLSSDDRRLVAARISELEYDLGSHFLKRGKFDLALDHLRRSRPQRWELHGKRMAKLALARWHRGRSAVAR